jgi:hypothetical protein
MPLPRTVLAAILLLLAAAPARAQAPADAEARDTAGIRAAVATACPGGHVRLHLLAGGTEQGRCGPVMDGRLLLRDGTAAGRTVELETVRSVWVERRRSREGATRGALIGAGATALVSGVLMETVCQASHCRNDTGITMVLGGVLGGVVGFVVGGIDGSARTRWERRYP